MPFRALAPAVFLITLMFVITSVILTDAASARDRRSPASGGRRESSAQKTPDRRNDPGPSIDRRKDPVPSTNRRKDPSPSIDRRKDPVTRPISKRDKDNSFRRKPPREHKKDPSPYKKKERDDSTRPKKGDGHGGGHIIPVIPGNRRPPWRRPRPHIHYHYTNIYYDYRTYVYRPIILNGLIDDDLYGINLPFGPILPWEIGEFYLIRLKNLEREGLGGSMMTTIVQTIDEMGWEEFLGRFGNNITDVMYYGSVGRTSFLVAMTVSDILDLMVLDGIRWVGELYPEYKIVPGGRNSKFFVRSLEGDTTRFRRELRDTGVFVMGFDTDTQEYYVRSSQDIYDMVAKLWWVARVSGARGEPFFQPESEWLDVGMAP